MAGRPPCLPSTPEMTLSLGKPGKRPSDPGLPLMGDHRCLGPQGWVMPSQDIKPCVQDPITQFLEKQVNRYMLLSNLQRAGKAPPECTCSGHLLPPSAEGVVWRGEGRLSFQLRWCGPPRPPIRGSPAAHRDEGVSAWVSPHTGVFRVVFHTLSLSHSFFTPPFSSVIPPPCFELHHPLMTRSLVSWAPPVCWAPGRFRGHLI